MDNNKKANNQEKGDIIYIMKEDYFANLPLEITIDILSRLPIRTIMMCKVVCKSWCNLVTSVEFAKSHLSRSVPGLAVSQELGEHVHDPLYKVFEFVDEIDHFFHEIFNFKFPHDVEIRSSVDGLLALGNGGACYYICNPVTREYIKLPLPPSPAGVDVIGLGVSKITRQYKLVRIALSYKSPKCEIYTLGSGSWRSIAADHSGVKRYRWYDECVFLKGILHWLAFDSNNLLGISCFDLETELFSTFSIPGLQCSYSSCVDLTTLRDCLCLCDYWASIDEAHIWLMKEYGDDRVWTKEFVIKNSTEIPLIIIDFKVFIDGDILMAEKYGPELVRFSPRINTIRTIHLVGLDNRVLHTTKVVYTPSFLPVLKNFVKEDVTSF